ncbi:hypothetical protein B0H34DRAFT_665951 [Crassisporium funariophilum]|nr:hypothetical protein B0H34DRAFT_665951 [Crassisporium funariophilum]
MRVRQHRPTRSRDSPSPYDLDNDSEDEDTTNPSLRGPKEDGALSMLPKMPVDVLYEIFSHLHAKDVLSLSRTTHGLRAILMDRHARSVWKSSLGNVWALPVCPSDLTEPQYANLTFDEHCHVCSDLP